MLKKRIIVIPDIHGDLNLLREMLKKANIIDDEDEWINNNKYETTVVQVGDQIDDCRDSCDKMNDEVGDNKDCDVIYFMHELEIKARKYNDVVISLIGNHELMNIENDFRYVNIANNETIDKRRQMFKDGKIRKILNCRHLLVVIDGNLFIHAGITMEIIDKFEKAVGGECGNDNLLECLDYKFMEWFREGNVRNVYQECVWNRELGTIEPNVSIENIECNKHVVPILKKFNLRRIIVGHTVQNNGINGTCNKTKNVNSKEYLSTATVLRCDGGYSVSMDPTKKKKFMLFEIIDQMVRIINE